jgi:hypothetical protein
VATWDRLTSAVVVRAWLEGGGVAMITEFLTRIRFLSQTAVPTPVLYQGAPLMAAEKVCIERENNASDTDAPEVEWGRFQSLCRLEKMPRG